MLASLPLWKAKQGQALNRNLLRFRKHVHKLLLAVGALQIPQTKASSLHSSQVEPTPNLKEKKMRRVVSVTTNL